MKNLVKVFAIALLIFLAGGFFFAEEAQAQWSLGMFIETDNLVSDSFVVDSVFPTLYINFKDEGLDFFLYYDLLTTLRSKGEFTQKMGNYFKVVHQLISYFDLDGFFWGLEYQLEPTACVPAFLGIDILKMELYGEVSFRVGTAVSSYWVFEEIDWKLSFDFGDFDLMAGLQHDSTTDFIVEVDYFLPLSETMSLKLEFNPTVTLFVPQYDEITGLFTEVIIEPEIDLYFEFTFTMDITEDVNFYIEIMPEVKKLLSDLTFELSIDLEIEWDISSLLGIGEEEEE